MSRVIELTWCDDEALLICGEPTEADARKIATEYWGEGEPDIGPITRYRCRPTPHGEYDCWYEENRSKSIIGTFKARLVQ